METRNITTFIRVAELRSFSKTAKQLGYSQAAVTVQVHQLEKELDTKLFDRIGKKIQLTESGKRFLPYAMDIMRANEAARTFMQQDTEISGCIRIATSSSMASGNLPEVLLGFSQEYPHVNLVVKTSDDFDSNFEKLKQNEVDLAIFIDRKKTYEDCITVARKKENLAFVTYPEHPFVGRKQISIEEIVQKDFIGSDKEVSYPHSLKEYLNNEGVEYSPCMEISSIHAIMRILSGGKGIALLPESSVKDAVEAGRLVVLDTEPILCPFYSQMVIHKNKWIDSHLHAFMEYVQKKFEKEN